MKSIATRQHKDTHRAYLIFLLLSGFLYKDHTEKNPFYITIWNKRNTTSSSTSSFFLPFYPEGEVLKEDSSESRDALRSSHFLPILCLLILLLCYGSVPVLPLPLTTGLFSVFALGNNALVLASVLKWPFPLDVLQPLLL